MGYGFSQRRHLICNNAETSKVMHTASGNWITEGTFDRVYYSITGELF